MDYGLVEFKLCVPTKIQKRKNSESVNGKEQEYKLEKEQYQLC